MTDLIADFEAIFTGPEITATQAADQLAQAILNYLGTSVVTTKGDLYTHTSTASDRLPVGTNGSLLVADSSQATGLRWAADQYRLRQVLHMFENTTYAVPSGVRAIYVECIGAGAGGGGAQATGSTDSAWGGGGGGGAYAAKWITNLVASYPIVVGVGGLGGLSNVIGTDGLATSFGVGPLVQASGGFGGQGMAQGSSTIFALGGSGGDVSLCVGDIKIAGAPGNPGQRISGTVGLSGLGGSAAGIGGGGGNARTDDSDGNPAQAYGGGGGGASGIDNIKTGGSGANGLVRIWEFV